MSVTVVNPPLEEVQKYEQIDVEFARDLRANPDVPKEDRLKLNRYLKTIENGNHKKVLYRLGKSMRTANLPLGRLCAVDGMGLQSFSRDIRAALAGRFYWDIDVVNAMPTILIQYCEKNGWVCPALKRYVETREEVLEEVMRELGIARWEAKEKIVALYNGGSSDGLTPFLARELGPEARMLMKNIWNANSETLKWLKSQPNHYGKGTSWIYQTEERKVLLAMEASFAKHGRTLDVYIHDGGLVRKREGEVELPSKMLREVEADIKEMTGYTVRLIVKPLETTYERTGDDEGEYAEKKKSWEDEGWKGATWFKLRHPPCFVAMFPDGKLDQLSKNELLQNEEDNILASGEPFVKRWLLDPAKREYQRLVFAPKQDPPAGCFNLFQGFANVPKAGEYDAFQTCLRIVSGNEQQVFDYIENWLAHIIQKPYVKTKVAICVQGEQGAGKDSFWDAVGDYILGQKYYLSTKTPENDIFAKFNSRAGYKILVKFEEADFHTNKENASKLKGLITSTHGHIEKKGHDPIDLEDFTNIVMTTNSEVPVVIEDSDRRFMLVKASSERLGDTAFWDDIHAKLPLQASAYHHYLATKDISDFVPWNQTTLPRTQYYKDVKQSFNPYHARFFQRQIELEVELNYTAHALFSRMKSEAPTSLQLSETRFGRDMRVYVEAGVFTKQKSAANNTYRGDAPKLREFLERKGWWVDY